MASIVVLDSGVGGLSVYQEICKQCINDDIVFVSDNDAFPYGVKPEDELIKRVVMVADCISELYTPDVLVIACNTASTIVLPILRERYDFDVVGVVPAIKPAASLSKTKHICLLATPGTISRQYTDDLIANYAQNCEVLKIGSTELVQLAEQKLQGGAIDLLKLSAIIKPVLDDESIDVIILACTHFPLLNKEIADVVKSFDRNVLLLDSAVAVAQRVFSLIESYSNECSSGGRFAVFTKKVEVKPLLENLSSYGFSEIHHLTI